MQICIAKAMKKQIKVYIFNKEQHGDDWPPTEALECLTWFARKLELNGRAQSQTDGLG